MSVLLETSCGDIIIDLHFKITPKACLNFLKLCHIKYYNDCHFFRIDSSFVAQTGDPLNTGTGGSSVFAHCNPPGPTTIPAEHSARLTHARAGTVSLTATSSTKPTHGSQFFITLVDNLRYLDNVHTVFAHVAEGMSVVLDKLARTPVDENNRPFRVLRIRHTSVLHDPFPNPPGLPLPPSSPPPDQTVPDDRLFSDDDDTPLGAPQHDSDSDGETLRRLEEDARQDREARARAEVLEMVGDIADADLKPPDNVLFICKLNPVTQPSDLDTIFSRFGQCKADILRDRQTGDSLCYGFVEFQTKEQCERAFYKMENAVIDFRQIRVDFSQSVSKLWNRARREKRALLSSAREDTRIINNDRRMLPHKRRIGHTDQQRQISDERRSSELVSDRHTDEPTEPVMKKVRRKPSRFDQR